MKKTYSYFCNIISYLLIGRAPRFGGTATYIAKIIKPHFNNKLNVLLNYFIYLPLKSCCATLLGSGCFGLRYRFGNPRFTFLTNTVKQSQTNTIQLKKIASGFALAMALPNESEAVPASPPSASLTQFNNVVNNAIFKIVKLAVLLFSFYFLLSFTSSLYAQRRGTYYYPQFFRGAGIFIAANHSMHHYINNNEEFKDFFNPVFTYYYPPSHFSREYFSWGVGIFAEFLPFDNIRWQTELEYTHKGAKERLLLDWFWGSVSEKFYPNKYTYLQWNNYLKWFFLRNNYGTFYWMFGIRLEYLLGQSISVYAPISSSFPKLWWSGDIGLGYEWDVTWFRYFHPFVEYHWNPDVIYHTYKKDLYNVKVRNRTFELRIGLIYRPKGRAIDDCNAPKYRGVEF